MNFSKIQIAKSLIFFLIVVVGIPTNLEAKEITPCLKGFTYRIAAQHEKALIEYSKCIVERKFEPSILAHLYARKGFSLVGLQRYEDAIDDFSKAISLSRDIDYAFRGRANSYFQLKKFDLAISDLHTSMPLVSYEQLGPHYTLLAMAYEGKGNLKKAIEYHAEAFELKSADPNVALAIASFFHRHRMHNEAKKALDYLILLQPNTDTHLLARGEINEILGETENAKIDYKEAFKLGNRSDFLREKLEHHNVKTD